MKPYMIYNNFVKCNIHKLGQYILTRCDSDDVFTMQTTKFNATLFIST